MLHYFSSSILGLTQGRTINSIKLPLFCLSYSVHFWVQKGPNVYLESKVMAYGYVDTRRKEEADMQEEKKRHFSVGKLAIVTNFSFH